MVVVPVKVSVLLTLVAGTLKAKIPAEARVELIRSLEQAAPVLARDAAQLAGAVSLLAEQLAQQAVTPFHKAVFRRRILEIRRNWAEDDLFCLPRNRIVAYVFIRPFYDNNVVSIYEFLQIRFGVATRNAASGVFLITRLLIEARPV